MKQQRVNLLIKLALLYLNGLEQPSRAVVACEAATRGIPICSEPLEKLIPQFYPKATAKAADVFAIDRLDAASVRLPILEVLAASHLAARNLPAAAEARQRAMLLRLIEANGDWNAGPAVEAEEFWQIARQLPADKLPNLLWLHQLTPTRPDLEFKNPEDGPHKYPFSFPGPRIVIHPEHHGKTLTVSADMDCPNGAVGGVRVFMFRNGKVRPLGWVQWHADGRKGREWRTATFDLPEDTDVIRLEIKAGNGTDFHVCNFKVAATFAPSTAAPAAPAKDPARHAP
jgi:hypothetical protein